ncbi:MAG: hypothetical protein KDE20_20465 [Caldilineaceae bacterium]|nr:hypothetical protein [Caldilineaceae bacterium]
MDQNSTKVAPAPTALDSPAPAPVDPLQTPVPVVSTSFKTNHPELYKSWVEHIQAGYRNNDQVFQRILDAFMRSHTSTVIMYWVLFGVGVGFFVVAASLALFRDALGTSMVFGGLSIVAFLTYFVSRPTQAVEENLQYVTWLGIIYNSYWTRLAWAFDEKTAQQVLDEATTDAVEQISTLIDKHAASTRGRPTLRDQVPGLGPSDNPNG